MTENGPHRIKALLYALSPQEGGRKTPFGLGYRPLFRLNDVGPYTSSIIERIEDGLNEMEPGEIHEVEMSLISPEGLPAQVMIGTRFELCEGLTAIGWGIVKACLNPQ